MIESDHIRRHFATVSYSLRRRINDQPSISPAASVSPFPAPHGPAARSGNRIGRDSRAAYPSPDHGIRIALTYKGSIAPNVLVFANYIGAVLCHSDILFRPSQFARKPPHCACLHRVGCQQPCLSTVTLTAPEGTVLEAVRRILYAECQHPRLARGATRALDRQEFWIGLSHARSPRIR
jgi:hypothetical protein